jgi:hypothetical protein
MGPQWEPSASRPDHSQHGRPSSARGLHVLHRVRWPVRRVPSSVSDEARGLGARGLERVAGLQPLGGWLLAAGRVFIALRADRLATVRCRGITVPREAIQDSLSELGQPLAGVPSPLPEGGREVLDGAGGEVHLSTSRSRSTPRM